MAIKVYAVAGDTVRQAAERAEHWLDVTGRDRKLYTVRAYWQCAGGYAVVETRTIDTTELGEKT